MESRHVTYDVVISGMGPAALACAMEAVKTGLSVLIVSDRSPDFVRPQQLLLTKENKHYLLGMTNLIPKQCLPLKKVDWKFIKELLLGNNVAIKDIERFIKRRLDEFQTSGVKIEYMYTSQLSAIDFFNATVAISSADKVEPIIVTFKHLVGADGAKHHAFTLAKKDNNFPAIEHAEITPDINSHHVSAYFIATVAEGQNFTLPDDDIFASDDQGLYTSILLNNRAKLKNDGKIIKGSFTGMLPDSIYNIKNEEERNAQIFIYIKEGISALFSAELDIKLTPASTKHGEKKDKVKFNVFDSTVSQAERAGVKVGNVDFFLVGDAYRGSQYKYGSGLNNALYHAQGLGSVLSNQLDLEGYNQLCEHHVQDHNRARSADIFKVFSSYPLHYAAYYGYFVIADTLLSMQGEKYGIDQLNEENIAPLTYAAQNGHVDTVRVLLDKGAQVNQENQKHLSPLYAATFRGHLDVITLLLDRGAAINQTNVGGYTPLYSAALRGHKDVVALLLDRGADINQVSKNGGTPLFVAAQNGYLAIVKTLIERQADTSSELKLSVEAIRIFSNAQIPKVSENIEKLIKEKLAENERKPWKLNSLWNSDSEKNIISISVFEIAKAMGNDDVVEYLESLPTLRPEKS